MMCPLILKNQFCVYNLLIDPLLILIKELVN
jgi:hypothetical protein